MFNATYSLAMFTWHPCSFLAFYASAAFCSLCVSLSQVVWRCLSWVRIINHFTFRLLVGGLRNAAFFNIFFQALVVLSNITLSKINNKNWYLHNLKVRLNVLSMHEWKCFKMNVIFGYDICAGSFFYKTVCIT